MFKPGDKVICVDPEGVLKLGEIYTIDSVEDPFVYLKEIEDRCWCLSRFSLAPMQEKGNKEESKSSNTQDLIEILFTNFKEFLKEKNKRYGDSALHPLNIFSKESTVNEICNRLDDKLSRIKASTELRKNDVADVFGYIALLLISKGWMSFEDLLD